ncbi:MAG: hypothetical protein U7123_16445 [Potamolinea sp.]
MKPSLHGAARPSSLSLNPAKVFTDKGEIMNPTMLRQLWSLIEKTQTNLLLKLDDASLVQSLLKQFNQDRVLNHEEIHLVSDYLNNRVSLIRDLAQGR